MKFDALCDFVEEELLDIKQHLKEAAMALGACGLLFDAWCAPFLQLAIFFFLFEAALLIFQNIVCFVLGMMKRPLWGIFVWGLLSRSMVMFW